MTVHIKAGYYALVLSSGHSRLADVVANEYQLRAIEETLQKSNMFLVPDNDSERFMLMRQLEHGTIVAMEGRHDGRGDSPGEAWERGLASSPPDAYPLALMWIEQTPAVLH